MKSYEIERKYLVPAAPENLSSFPYHEIEQGYLSTEPVVRIRRQDEEYYLTYKSKGLMIREEYNLPLTKESYLHLQRKNRRPPDLQTPLSDPIWRLYHRAGSSFPHPNPDFCSPRWSFLPKKKPCLSPRHPGSEKMSQALLSTTTAI